MKNVKDNMKDELPVKKDKLQRYDIQHRGYANDTVMTLHGDRWV